MFTSLTVLLPELWNLIWEYTTAKRTTNELVLVTIAKSNHEYFRLYSDDYTAAASLDLFFKSNIKRFEMPNSRYLSIVPPSQDIKLPISYEQLLQLIEKEKDKYVAVFWRIGFKHVKMNQRCYEPEGELYL